MFVYNSVFNGTMFQGVKFGVDTTNSQVCSLWFDLFHEGFWFWLNLLCLCQHGDLQGPYRSLWGLFFRKHQKGSRFVSLQNWIPLLTRIGFRAFCRPPFSRHPTAALPPGVPDFMLSLLMLLFHITHLENRFEAILESFWDQNSLGFNSKNHNVPDETERGANDKFEELRT